MGLGLAKEKLAEGTADATVAAMVDEAHGEVKLALQELRDLARGIHPAVLTDRGLGAALSSLGGRCTVPVKTAVDLPERPAAAIEGIAYFTVSELLQNISKHSGARSASVDVWRTGDRLLLRVEDDGRGGARPCGTGLSGLAERLDAVDGVFTLASPRAARRWPRRNSPGVPGPPTSSPDAGRRLPCPARTGVGKTPVRRPPRAPWLRPAGTAKLVRSPGEGGAAGRPDGRERARERANGWPRSTGTRAGPGRVRRSPGRGGGSGRAFLGGPFAARTWRAFGYIWLSLPIATATFVYAVTTLALGAASW
ncbi:sensor histidine kinase [Actinomadura keratinilytica]